MTRTIRCLAPLAFAATLAACGSSTDGTDPAGAQTFALASNQLFTIAADDSQALRATISASGVISYAITDMATGIGDDHMTAFVLDERDIADAANGNQPPHGGPWAVRENFTGSTSAATTTIPAATYDLILYCANAIDTCRFTLNANATF